MRTINLIVVHCSATQGNRMLSPEALDLMHRRRGFNGTGYHYYIRKDGTVHLTRPVERIGAHVKGFNANSIGICYEGGLDCRGRPADT
ncbi:N-acetylmuramoyl-L-alanine amidase, partial [Bacteroides sp. HMSC068A09]